MEILFILITIILVIVSLIKDKSKTKKAIVFSKGMFLNTVLDILGILLIIGLIITLIPPDLIKKYLGGENLTLSTIWGGLIGTVSIIPAFIAFPLSKSLLDSGAHTVTITAFLTTLTMVGIATFPLEVKSFGTKFTILRNSLSFIAAIIIALIMGVVL